MSDKPLQEAWPTAKHVGGDGKVRCWSVPDEKYTRAFAVDIREGQKIGTIKRFNPEDDANEVEKAENEEDFTQKVKKATAKMLQKIIEEQGFDVNLEDYENLGAKRAAVLEAANASEDD